MIWWHILYHFLYGVSLWLIVIAAHHGQDTPEKEIFNLSQAILVK